MKEEVVVAEHISKCYKIYNNPDDRIKDLLFRKNNVKSFYALKNLSFTVNRGDVVGLIGMNGSGKSTLANIVGGISSPTSGKIYLAGEPAVIAIASGLNNNLSGMENIELKGLMIGLSPKEIEKLKPSIIEFADIGDFIYQPVKTYSSGMKARLGFAISVNIDPDILVIDEALSVGDNTFTQKCLDKMHEFRDKGKTIFFVSHALGQITDFCSRVMWLEYGSIKAYGDTEEVVPMYDRFVKQFNRMSKEERIQYKADVCAQQEAMLGDFLQ